MKRINIPAMLLFTVLYLFSLVTVAQKPQAPQNNMRKDAIMVFIDCRTCDMSYTRQEIPWVNYVRDVREAEVYVLVTRQDAGSGGRQYTYTFHGMDRFTGMDDTLTFTSNPDETSALIREKRTNLLKAGLLRFAARTPMINNISISHDGDLEQEEVTDNWNNWVFEIQTSPQYYSEESYKNFELENSLRISKVTPDFKLQIDVNQQYFKRRYIEDELDTIYVRSYKGIDNLFVKSLGDHWSAGMVWQINASSSQNYDFNSMLMPSLEYDLYPYSEATYRQMRFLYSIGYQYSNYVDTTIYNKTSENLFGHQIQIAYEVQKKWGSINLSVQALNYFHDFSKNMVAADLYARIRIVKGLSLFLRIEAAHISNQLNLVKGELSEAERLLRLKEQATGYQVETRIGLTYTFGSIYNNIVNPRFGD
ncbi:MAG: hypothetical protein RBT02_07135 [Bacteroidales bacterium]|jgi:hypothetical protein|nr:hypothetical protein [Bacteroidales bacterium]